MPRRLIPALALTAVLAGGCVAGTGDSAPLRIHGAASTRVLNEDLAAAWDRGLEFHNAGSSTLVQQLADGAPGDILLTADQATMDRAVAAGVATDPVVVARNTLVMVVPTGNPGQVSIAGLSDAALVLCDEQVPCGATARRIIDDAGLGVSPVSLEHSVTDVLGKVVSGEADAGWVYATDARAAADAVEIIDIPTADAHPSAVVAAVSTSAGDPEGARAFVDKLASPEMAPVFARHGFATLSR